MDNQKPKRYRNPIDEKTMLPYHVPCVAKNKDALVYITMGIIAGANQICNKLDVDFEGSIDLGLSSFRYNDILPDGKRMSELTDDDYNRMKSDMVSLKQTHPENGIGSLNNHFLTLTCSCGNYYAFHKPEEIPDDIFFCGLCDRVLIDYTDTDEWCFEKRNK